MSILAKAYPAKQPRTNDAKRVALVYSGILAVMAIAQLIGFTKFVLVLDSYWLPGGLKFTSFLAGFLIVSELLSCAFLLRRKLSPAFRVFTMGLSWVVPVVWLILTIRAITSTTSLTNVGFLGGYVQLVPGWWAVFVSLALIILSAWATWGLWPFPFHTAKHKK